MASNDHISKAGRLARALELKTRGLTYAEISQRMAEEGYWHVSLRTINRLLNSLEAQTYVEELKRLQLRDITIAELPLRLKYRDRLLDKMMPQKVEQKITGQLKQDLTVKGNVTADQLAEVIPVILDMVMEEQVRRTGEEGPTDSDESMDTPKTDP